MEDKYCYRMNFEEKVKWLKRLKHESRSWSYLASHRCQSTFLKRTHMLKSFKSPHGNFDILVPPRRIFSYLIPSIHAAEVPPQIAEGIQSPDTSVDTQNFKTEPEVEPPAAAELYPPGIVTAPSRVDLTVSDDEIQAYLAQETGRDRIRKMFEKTDTNAINPEVDTLLHLTKYSAMMSFFMGSVLGGRQAKEDFILESKHKKFATKFRAGRAYQDAIMLGGLKMGAFLAIRTLVFTGMFLFSSQCIATYRNKTSVLEYSVAGLCTGGILRLNLGLRGLIAGGIVGGFMGTVFGIPMWGYLWYSGETQQDRHRIKIHKILQDKKEIRQLAAGSL